MDIRTILVSCEIDTYSPTLAKCAGQLAQRFGAELIGLAAAVPAPIIAATEVGLVSAEWYEQDRDEIESRLRKLEAEFRGGIPAGVPVHWRAILERPNGALVENARSADLLLVAGRMEDQYSGYLRSPDIGELILAAGRPVIVTALNSAEVKSDSILIGWKDTREARRSVADALPFSKIAKQVSVATVHEGDLGAEKASVADVLAWLSRHGVAAKGDLHPLDDSSAVTLESLAKQENADMVVTGAYGHNRLREWLFGGMTRELLANPTLTRFMSN
jgi:nucleotide-binding universal stress UspA family protein